MSDGVSTERKKRRTLLLLAGLAIGMFGFGFAMVPLYGLLCQLTGVQSVEQRAAAGENLVATSQTGAVDEDRWVTVKLDATVQFVAENGSGSQITGQAIPSIAPWQATGFFSYLECFCCSQQTLAGNERKEMPLRFSVSPDLPADIGSLTLSYSVLRVSDPDSLVATQQSSVR